MFWIIVLGSLVGATAKLSLPGRDSGGLVITMMIGIAGSVIAGLLGHFIGWYREGDVASFIVSIVGAIILVFVYRRFTGEGKPGKSGAARAA